MKKLIYIIALLGVSVFADNLFDKIDKGEAKVNKSIKDTKNYIGDKTQKIQDYKKSKEQKIDKSIKDTKDYIGDKKDNILNQTKDFLSK